MAAREHFSKGELTVLDPLAIAVGLMAVDSTSGHEGEAIALLDQMLASQGWILTRIPVTAGRDCLLARSDDRAPSVTLSTHIDTVPPYIAPRVDGARLWGRGSCDAKGIAAAMICAAERLRADGMPVALLFVVGEETCHDGAHAANAFAIGGRVLINGEPTESRLALGTKGAVRCTLTVTGEAAHSAYPERGRSATMALVQLLATLDSVVMPHDELLGASTVHIGHLAGGVADNVIAPWAEARLMARTVGPAEDVMALLREWAGDRGVLTQGATVPAVRLGTVPGFETTIAAFATDIPALTSWGTPYLFGPGSIHVAHRDDEHIEIAELRAAVDSYVRLAHAAAGVI